MDSDIDPDDLLCNEAPQQVLARSANDNNLQANAFDPLVPANIFLIESDDLEYIQNLLTRETLVSPDYVDSLSTNGFLKNIRAECVEWMINAHLRQGHHCLTIYLSVTYFDRCLARRVPNSTETLDYRLLSLVCFAIAAKMQESKVPRLRSLVVGGYVFGINAIEKTEMTVLRTLAWHLTWITPFNYLHYFIAKMCPSSIPKEIFHKAEDILAESVKENHFLYHYPSIVTAAAVLVAYNTKLNRHTLKLKLDAISSIGPLNIAQVCSCYLVIRDKEMRGDSTPPTLITSPPGRTRLSDPGGSRRRLEFVESSRPSPLRRTSQH